MHLDKQSALWETLGAVIADEGLVLYDAEKHGDHLLRVAIARRDSAHGAEKPEPEKNRGVTSADCTAVCRRLMVFFLAEGEKFGLRSDVQIEVSSPGINRELRLAEHFAGAVGERVRVVLLNDRSTEGARGQDTVAGRLEQFAGDRLLVLPDGESEPLTLPLTSIKKARVDFKF